LGFKNIVAAADLKRIKAAMVSISDIMPVIDCYFENIKFVFAVSLLQAN